MLALLLTERFELDYQVEILYKKIFYFLYQLNHLVNYFDILIYSSLLVKLIREGLFLKKFDL